MEQKVNKIVIAALFFSCVSLLLATIPPYIIDNKIQTLEQQSIDAGKPISLEFKGIKLNFTKHQKNERTIENKIKVDNLAELKQKIKISLYMFSALSIFLGIYSLAQKRNRPISLGSITIASFALAWQYIATGVTIGVAIVVAILILGNIC